MGEDQHVLALSSYASIAVVLLGQVHSSITSYSFASARKLLHQADALLVRLMGPEHLEKRAKTVAISLADNGSPTAQLSHRRLVQALDSAGGAGEAELQEAMAQAMGILSRLHQEEYQREEFKLPGLRKVRGLIGVALLILLAAAPILIRPPLAGSQGVPVETDPGAVPVEWRVPIIDNLPGLLQLYIMVLSIAVLGCVGGTLSGFIAARQSSGLLLGHKREQIGLVLRPLVGAMVAVALFILLTWGVLAGVSVTNPGIYMLLAILAGFSERYFAQMLNSADPLHRATIDESTSGAQSVVGRSPSPRVR